LYLKRLEVLGFKSFADKIKLEFLPGVTAVVGPNGSGKSNIADALRWVLGEQSIKNLRGAKMDDVIFNGSELRKPLGLAEVTMVLDNSDHGAALDFTEIAVTRRLFRSGLSEYLINKASVRLRDIQELFCDTGLGKDAYSVIGQGKIDAILSVKAEERRSIFEEAAGIIKYKSRKQVAERKLGETDASLLRIKDIINELNNQLGPLENQACRATQFLNYQTELTGLAINYYNRMLSGLQTGLTEFLQSKKELEEQHHSLESESDVVEAELETGRLQLISQDDRINQLHEDYYRIQNMIDKYREQVNFSSRKLADLAKQEVELDHSLTVNCRRNQTMAAQQTLLAQEIDRIKLGLEEDQVLLGDAERRLVLQTEGLNQLEANELKLKEDLIAVLNDVAALKNQVNSAALQKNFLMRQLEDCQKKLTGLKTQRMELEATSHAQATALAEVNTAIAVAGQSRSELSRRAAGWEAELNAGEAGNHELQQKIRGLEGRISVLTEMEKSHEGYFKGVKALLDEAAGHSFRQAIRGVVAALIKVRPGMELALETALGSALQNVVIADDRAAQEAIAYLKKQGKGRATFLPLNQVRATAPRWAEYQAHLTQYGAQPALELLEFDPEYQQVFNYLLNQVIVAPDLQAAVRLGAKLDRGLRVVTPEGDLVNPGGSITGGSIDRRRVGLLSRRPEIEALQAVKREAEAALAQGSQQVKKSREALQDCQSRIEALKKQEQDANLQRVALEQKIHAINGSLAQLTAQDQAEEAQLEKLTAESGQLATGDEALARDLARGELELQTIEAKLAAVTTDLNQAKQRKEETGQVLSELKAGLGAGQQELNGKMVLQENYLKQAAEATTSREQFQQKKAELQLERERINLTVADLNRKIVAANEELGGQQELLDAAKLAKDQLSGRVKELEAKGRNFRRKGTELQNRLHRLDLACNDRQSEIEHLQADLTEDYGSEWRTQSDPDWVEPENAIGRINRLKSRLKELGTVNLNAIDEFGQVQERYQFLSSQAEDLVKARESLSKVIDEIERTIKQRFSETFQLARVEFKKLFSKLFEGGNADLFLLEPEDLLNSGIEIVAQPPGKKLQSLSLLSGGERAMTATALLFAILSIKPAPFCILDEIDAALDDANVQRFARLLELFSVQTQFIVVTHRRGTMEVANALYGVTMEERGISKLISLELNREKAG
jgi:chromosome segregation protein